MAVVRVALLLSVAACSSWSPSLALAFVWYAMAIRGIFMETCMFVMNSSGIQSPRKKQGRINPEKKRILCSPLRNCALKTHTCFGRWTTRFPNCTRTDRDAAVRYDRGSQNQGVQVSHVDQGTGHRDAGRSRGRLCASVISIFVRYRDQSLATVWKNKWVRAVCILVFES